MVIFSPDGDEAGTLGKMLKIFTDHNVNLVHIESRSSERRPGYEFIAECDSRSGNLGAALDALQEMCGYFSVISRDYKDNKGKCGKLKTVPEHWSPTCHVRQRAR